MGWLGLVVAMMLLGFYRLFARGGAAFLVDHPWRLRGNPRSPTEVRLLYCLLVLCGVIGVLVNSFPGFLE